MVPEWSGVKLGDNQENMEYCDQSSFFFLFHTLQHTQDLSTQSYNWNIMPVSTSNLLADYA